MQDFTVWVGNPRFPTTHIGGKPSCPKRDKVGLTLSCDSLEQLPSARSSETKYARLKIRQSLKLVRDQSLGCGKWNGDFPIDSDYIQ
jgi:hypothetical protein